MNDPRLDRRPEYDERSRRWLIRDALTGAELERPVRSFTWSLPPNLVANPLDQGREGACVGFYGANELAARPWPDPNMTNDIALLFYRESQRRDEWPGEDYDGTSGLGLMRYLAEIGVILEYRWAGAGTQTPVDDLVRGIAHIGPAGLGIPWYTGMFRPESDGRLRVTGQIEGHHQILANRVTGERWRVAAERRRLYLWNSWGKDDGWPVGWIDWEDAERLLRENGDAVIPVIRKRTPIGDSHAVRQP